MDGVRAAISIGFSTYDRMQDSFLKFDEVNARAYLYILKDNFLRK